MTPEQHEDIARRLIHAERSGDAETRRSVFRAVAALPRPDADAVAAARARLGGPPPVSPKGGTA